MLRLSELLERIRPAGSPGAAAEGDEQHRHSLVDEEIADVVRLLAGFEREAQAVVTDAHEEAERIRREGERRVEQINAGRADRVARARTAGNDREQDDVERDTIVEATRREVDRLRHVAATRSPALASTIVDSIWSVLPSEDRP